MVLAHELKTKKPGVVGISTVTDPYQPLEKKYSLTRFCLEQLLRYDFPAHIQTKSALVTRDIDLLTRFTNAQVMFSIGTFHDDERTLLEPHSSSIQDRLLAITKCTDAGLSTSVFFGPVYPTTTISEIPRILDRLADAGIKELWVDPFRLKPGIWENVQKKLLQHQEIFRLFSKQELENKKYYATIREEIQKRGKERNLKIIDAF
jgi:DNA repair photolyase